GVLGGLAVDLGHDHGRALPSQARGVVATDALAASGHDGHAILESHRSLRSHPLSPHHIMGGIAAPAEPRRGDSSMISKEQNERMTQTGADTPMGKMLRMYWQVVGIAPELDKEPVQPVRILGEDLTLFKTERGEIGLIGERCAHRAISLAYGIPQNNG